MQLQVYSLTGIRCGKIAHTTGVLPWLGVGSKRDGLGWPAGRADLYVRAVGVHGVLPWVRIRGQISMGDIVCYRLHD